MGNGAGKKKLPAEEVQMILTSFGVGSGSENHKAMRSTIKRFHSEWTKATDGSMVMDEAQFLQWWRERQMAQGEAASGEALVRDLFKILDQDNSGCLEFQEAATLLALQTQLANRSNMDYASLMVAIYDADGDKKISRTEYVSHLRVITQAAGAEVTPAIQQTFDDKADVLFEYADEDGDGQLTAEEIARAFDEHPELRQKFQI